MELKLAEFETSKRLKKAGFVHMKANCYGDNMCYQLPEGNLINALAGNTVLGYILAPTLELAKMWLREKHDIHVTVHYHKSGKFNVGICDECENPLAIDVFGEFYNSYEEALEMGINEALKLIIQEKC